MYSFARFLLRYFHNSFSSYSVNLYIDLKTSCVSFCNSISWFHSWCFGNIWADFCSLNIIQYFQNLLSILVSTSVIFAGACYICLLILHTLLLTFSVSCLLLTRFLLLWSIFQVWVLWVICMLTWSNLSLFVVMPSFSLLLQWFAQNCQASDSRE